MFESLSSDPLFSLLRTVGYNVVRLPKPSIKPLQLFAKKNNELFRLGELTDVFKSRTNVAVPEFLTDSPMPNISGIKSGDFNIGLGLSLAGNIISSFGGKAPGLESVFKKADTIAFQYEAVLEDSIGIAQLDQFLFDSDINPLSKYVAGLLDSDQVYVATATLKSRKFTILPKSSKDSNLDVNLPQVQNLMGSNIKVTSFSQNSAAITFEGTIPLVFGFQAQQLFYDKGRYTRQEPAKPNIVMRGPSGSKSQKLLTQGPFASFSDQ